MTRPSVERLFTVLSRTIRRSGIKPRWQSIGSLIDVLSQDKENDDIVAWLCQTLHASEHLTRSVFCCSFFDYIGLPAVSAVVEEEHLKYHTNGKPNDKDNTKQTRSVKNRPDTGTTRALDGNGAHKSERSGKNTRRLS